MMKKTLIHVSLIGLMFSLAACSSETTPDTTPTVTETVTASTMPSETPTESSSAPSSAGPSSTAPKTTEPPATQAPAETAEIPEGLQGKWLFIGEAQDWPACDTIEDPGKFVEIDATTVSFFAVLDTLETVEQNDGTTFVGEFTYQGDGDTTGTSRLQLTLVNEKVMEFTDLDGDTDPSTYGRCL